MKYKIFRQWNTTFSLQKVLELLSFGFPQNCVDSRNFVVEIQLKLLNERASSTGEPCPCEYVTFLQSFHRGTLSIHWYISKTFSLGFLCQSCLDTHLTLLYIYKILKVAMPTSNFMKDVYNPEFLPESSVSILREIIALVSDYV